MHATIGRSILSVCFALGVATAAHADTVYTFTRSTTVNEKVTASGSITVNQTGTNLLSSAITTWDINFSANGFTDLHLTPANSTFTFLPGTVINALMDLSIAAPTQSAGFTLNGDATERSDTFAVEWIFGDGPAELMTIGVPGGSVIAEGANFQTYPVTFTTDAVGAPSPVPEPSSLLLLGTGSLTAAAAGLRRMRSAVAGK